MATSNPVDPKFIRRVKWFLEDHGVWVVMVLAFSLTLVAGFAIGSAYVARNVQGAVMAVRNAEAEAAASEKSRLLDVIDKKNDDVNKCVANLAALGGGSNATAQKATDAVQSATEALKGLKQQQ